MPSATNTVKVPIGMRHSFFFPITAETDNAKATYGDQVNMGAAVKGYLAVTTASGEIRGDDIAQVSMERFVSGTLDVETTLSDLEVNATLFGHTYGSSTGEVSKSDDSPANGGYAFIEPIMKKDKTVVYRASVFPKVCAVASSEKQEADTKPSGDLSAKMNALQFKVMEDATSTWRVRNEFNTEAAALSFISTWFNPPPAPAG